MELFMNSIEEVVHETETRLSVHEAVCAERYEGIQNSFEKGIQRMQKIEYMLYFVIFSVLFGKEFVIDLVKHYLLEK
jgi:hypothetical protein